MQGASYPQQQYPQYPNNGNMQPPNMQPPNMQPMQVMISQPQQLNTYPVVYTCPNCHESRTTRTKTESGSKTWIWCVLLLFFGCGLLCWVPFIMDSCKDTRHNCANCNYHIGTFEKKAC